MQKKHCWTRFSFTVLSADAFFDGTLNYILPVTPDAASFDAIRKAEFMAATVGLDFDEHNLTLILRPYV